MDRYDLELHILAKKKDVIILPAHKDMWAIYYKGGFAMMTTENIKKSLETLPDKPWWKFW